VVIRTDTSIKNALDQGISIFELKSKSGICEDLDRLTRELLGITRWSEKGQQRIQ
jgi:hypothetical protein